jgi:hypothetical protein
VTSKEAASLDDIFEADRQARQRARRLIEQRGH